ncbi:MAG TPA: imidazolonepropionase [Anaerolineae bacterium]
MSTQVELLVYNIGQLLTLDGPSGPRRGVAMRDLGLIENGAVAITSGQIVATGASRALRGEYRAKRELDAGGRVVLPGFVDPHTHLPWAGDRADEFAMRIGGATYMQIMAAGGGIVRTVTSTRAATLAELVAETRGRLAVMLAYGTTTAEAKTGYGLNVEAELKQLEAIAELQGSQPVDLVPTFLGAHAVPAEYAGRTDAYVKILIDEMLPAGAQRWEDLRTRFPAGWPHFCDVFCEDGAFDLAQSQAILEAGRRLGFGLKIHVDEFAPLGGTPLAVRLGAISVDHLVTTPASHLDQLAASNTIGVALPGTPFGLAQRDYSPARALIERDGALALATDLNPGTCWCESMQFVIALACRYMRLTPEEAICAATLNAAHAVGVGDRVGSLTPGKQADLLILDAANYRMLGYRFGTNLVATVIKRGQVVLG